MRTFHPRPLLSLSSLRRMTQPHMASRHRDPSPHHDNDIPSKRRRLHTSPSGNPPMPPLPTITLSEQEESVRQLLVDVGAEIDANAREDGAQDQEPIVLRFTGGWVRDKLLGIPSHDIDVGINRMTGFDFGNRLAHFLERNKETYQIPPRTIYKIGSNPEKSKHLETATTKILGLDIDLVNLRSESYSGDSRIPQMEFGTPVQDALRRDCTVNALFYNLHTQRVEDFTERGIEDMKNKLIRTPLAPFETFDDDPLRVLRLIRFSSRLGFEIVPEAKLAMLNPIIQSALRLKISRERVGTEIDKMLKSTNPHQALQQIYDLSLYTCIFAPPIDPLPAPPSLPSLPLAILSLQHILATPNHPHITTLLPTPNDIYLAWLTVALVPWNGYTFPDPNPKKHLPGAATAAREGLRVNNKVFATVVKEFDSLALIREELTFSEAGEWGRGRAGAFVRELGADWGNQVVCALLLDMVAVWKAGETVASNECNAVLDRYDAFVKKISDNGATEAYKALPKVNGYEVADLYKRKPGRWVQSCVLRIMDYQWRHPEADKAAVKEWIKANEELLGSGVDLNWKLEEAEGGEVKEWEKKTRKGGKGGKGKE